VRAAVVEPAEAVHAEVATVEQAAELGPAWPLEAALAPAASAEHVVDAVERSSEERVAAARVFPPYLYPACPLACPARKPGLGFLSISFRRRQ
jgi:hypothetical protein